MLPLRGGFNSVTKLDGRIYASHSELGQVMGEGEPRPVRLLQDMTREAKAIRCADSFGGLIYCSIDDKIVAFHPQQFPLLAQGEVEIISPIHRSPESSRKPIAGDGDLRARTGSSRATATATFCIGVAGMRRIPRCCTMA
jgi:hypothetical protein